MQRSFSTALLAGLAATFLTSSAFAQGMATLPDSGDTAWMLTATALVLMMTIPGLALFYGGMVRRKNALTTVAQCFAVTALATVLWIMVGYSLAFTDGGAAQGFIGGLDNAFLAMLTPQDVVGTIPETVYLTYQMTFAVITPALIVGAAAERMKFSAMLWFAGLWSLCVYYPVTHWVWGGGLLADKGALDFAGGLVVHLNAGVAGLVVCIVLGKRVGYGVENMAPHNLVFSLIGASLLWVGWFGFNAGSALSAGASAGMAMLVTQVAAAGATLGWMSAEWVISKKPSILGMVSGAVAGLVAITPAAGFVGPMGALAIGVTAGILCYAASAGVKRTFGYDDTLDVWGIHGVGGALGAVLTGVFAVEAIGGTPGALEGNLTQLWVQMEGVIYTVVYCGLVSFLLLKLIDMVVGLRVRRDAEVEGLDINLHGETIRG